jgi:hypothetical protein
MWIAGGLCSLLMAGCAAIEREPQRAEQTATTPAATTSTGPRGPSVAPLPEPPPSRPVEAGAVAPAPTTQPAQQAVPGSKGPQAVKPPQGMAKPAESTPKPRAPVAAPPSPATQAGRTQAPAAALAKPDAPPPLDLKLLETRLKETKAIGVFTKLALKNQIDDLLERFRAFYQGRLKTSLAELRRSFDLLVLKTLALLQDADPPLASAIASSRESIWAVLSNPAKFSTV